MKNLRWTVAVALLLCVVVAAAVPATVAFIANRSNTVKNTFRIEYLPPQDVTVPVYVHKTVECVGDETIGPAGFSFRLEKLNTGEVTSMTSFTDGWAETNLTFTADDAGKTYSYRLYEFNTGRENVTYDETVYTFAVTLQLNEQHEMTPIITMDGESVAEVIAEFVNVYDVMDIPDTGDHSNMLLWVALMLLGGLGLWVLFRKEFANGRQ